MPVMDGLQATREIFGHVLARPGMPGRTSSRSLRTWLNRWWKVQGMPDGRVYRKANQREKLNTVMEKITMWVMEGRQPQYQLDADGWNYR